MMQYLIASVVIAKMAAHSGLQVRQSLPALLALVLGRNWPRILKLLEQALKLGHALAEAILIAWLEGVILPRHLQIFGLAIVECLADPAQGLFSFSRSLLPRLIFLGLLDLAQFGIHLDLVLAAQSVTQGRPKSIPHLFLFDNLLELVNRFPRFSCGALCLTGGYIVTGF